METTVSKNRTGQIGHRTYAYVDIAQIHDYLESINARYYQYIDRIDGDDYIMTVKIMDGKEMPPLRGARVVDAKLLGSDNPAQLQGSALTYARRYSLLMAFGLATEDDDAQSLTREYQEKKATPKQIEYLARAYTGDNLKTLLEKNSIVGLEEMSFAKASDLISKLEERRKQGE